MPPASQMLGTFFYYLFFVNNIIVCIVLGRIEREDQIRIPAGVIFLAINSLSDLSLASKFKSIIDLSVRIKTAF